LTIDPDATKLPCSAASLLYPSRVARISRLIGKSDTTVNRHGWQVYFAGTFAHFGARCRKRHSEWNGVFAVLRWSLASQIMWWTALFPPYLLQTVPAGNSLFEGPLLLRMLLQGACSSLGWPDVTPAAGTSLAL
jgi:hypothetical protein